MSAGAGVAGIRVWIGRHWSRVELAAALLATVATFLVFGDGSQGSQLGDLIQGNRAVLYGTVAALAGSLLGFVLAAGAIIAPMLESPRMKRVRESNQYPGMWTMFLSATRGLGLLTVASVGALVFDRDAAPLGVLTYLVLFLAVLSALQVGTCVWILENVIKVLTLRREAAA
jgi:hypothetical protein